MLFSMIQRPGRLAQLRVRARETGIERVRVLLLIRDLIDMAASRWQQRLKRNGQAEDPAKAFSSDPTLDQVAALLSEASATEGVELTVLNYSRRRSRMLETAEDWLGLPPETLVRPQAATVNRSLTAGELSLVGAMNRDGIRADFVADALCERLPDLPAPPLYPPEPVQRAFIERMSDQIAEINAQLPEAERYETSLRPVTQEAATLSAEQIDVIASAFAQRLRDLDQARAEVRSTSDLLRTLLRRVGRRARIMSPRSPDKR